MTRVLYLDCIGGVAGDMLLGALIDAGADPDRVREGLAGLGVPGLELLLDTAERHGIGATRVEVLAAPEPPGRTWREVRVLLEQAELPSRARERALEAFRRLALAEARVHRHDPDEVHFHEVGAVDALADICGVALALDELHVERVECSPLPCPHGLVDAAHGTLPLPAPAVLELLAGAPLEGVEEREELVTPTGAALVAATAERFGPLPAMVLERAGYGAGTRELASRPNLVRAVLGEALEPARPAGAAEVALIETNLDDFSPELVPDAAERVAGAGALDVWVTPVQMKKGRPGVVLSALARPARERAVAEAMLRETTALGVRVLPARRLELEREWRTVEVDGEQVRVKIGSLDGEPLGAAPEHDDCAAVARRTGQPVRAVWTAASVAAAALIDGRAARERP